MRILMVTQAYAPFVEKGALAARLPVIARHLARRKHGVTVLTARYGNAEPAAAPQDEGIETVYLPTWLSYRAVTWNPQVGSFCRNRLDRFDVVHIYGLYDLLGPAVSRACRRQGLPYVVEPMGMTRPIVRNLRAKRMYHRLWGRRMMQAAQCIIVTSQQEREELVEYGISAERIVVRRNGVEPPAVLPAPGTFRKQWGIPSRARVVLFLGRLIAKKSPDLLIEAFSRGGRASDPPVPRVLVLAGPEEDRGYRESLAGQAARLGVESQVRFVGPLYGDAKWAAYRDADVFVLPSQNENFGNTVAEAVACGAPVVVTDRCGIAPWVDGKAGLVVPYDKGSLADALSRLLDDTSLHERFRAGCAEVARSLSWDEPVQQMETLYRELVTKTHAATARGRPGKPRKALL
jgi:glycosyltransferase involved in cell wall biosynthesis